MTTSLLEWNLGFPFDEVVEGLGKMCTTRGYAYTRIDREGETDLSVTLPSGTLTLLMQPLLSHRSPFSPLIILQRTLLTITAIAPILPYHWQTFQQHLTLAFLRAGG